MEEGDLANRFNCQLPDRANYPTFYSPESGVYASKHPARPLPQDPRQDLVSFLFSHRHLGTTALVDSASGSSISYCQLHSMVASVASGIRKLGIRKNEVVLLLLPNTIFFPVVFLGVVYTGAVATTMNPLSSREEIKKSTAACRVALAFASAKADTLGIRTVAVPEDPNFDPSEFAAFESIVSGNGEGPARPEVRQTDTAAVLYSSGTSGSIKGVALTHANMIAAAELFVRFEASQYGTEDHDNVYLAALPMFHVYGLSLFAVGLLSLGSTVVVMRRFDAAAAAKAIERFGVTHFPVVPPIMRALVRARKAIGCDLLRLKQVSSGAAPLNGTVIRDFLRSFPHVDFIQGYGMTESTAVGTRGFNTDKLKNYNSVGLLAPNMQAKIIHCDTDTCLPPGKSGELWLRGPAIMKGYLNETTIDKNGWLRTGDIAYFDEDGYLYVLDRLKDTIKYKGYQIAPADLEALLISHPDIVDVGVTFGKDEEVGEIPIAFVVRKPGSQLSSDDVMEYVSKRVAPYKKVRKVVFVLSIPKSPTGKILRRLLRSNHGNSKM